MAQLILITGLAQSQRQTRIRRILQGEAKNPLTPPDYIYLAPTRRKVKHTQDWLLKQAGKSWSPLAYNLGELALVFYLKLGGRKRLINGFCRRLIIHSLLTDPAANWEFFTPNKLNPGLVKAIAGFIAKAKTYCYGNLSKAIRHYRLPGELQAKDSDLLNLYKGYHHLLNQKNLIDSQDMLTEVIKLLEEKKQLSQSLQRIHTLVIDGFYYFKPLEQEFIKAVIKIFDQTLVSLDCHNPKDSDDHQLITNYLNFWRQLGASPEHSLRLDKSPDNPTPYNRSFLDISRHLFKQPAEKITIPTSKLTICSLPKRHDEVKAIARNIRQIMSKHPGVSLNHIYMAFPQMEIYAPLIHELFPRYGIPYEITEGYPLRSSPVTGVILKILAIRLNNYLREDWCALFSSELVDYSATIKPTGERQLNMPLIDYWLRLANVRGGADWQKDWRSPLSKIIRIDKEERIELDRQLSILHKAWTEFEHLPTSLTSREFMQGLLHLIKCFNIPQNIVRQLEQIHNYKDRDKEIIIKRELKALDKLNSLLKEMASALKLVGKDNTKIPLSEFHSMLLDYLNVEEYYSTDYTEERVQVVETPELQGLYFEYLFLGGLVEEEFPRPEPRELFYPSSTNKRLFNQLPRLAEDRYLFSYIFKNTKSKICLSYPSSDQGNPRLPSPFIDEVKQIVGNDIDMLKTSSPPSSCYTRQELLCNIAADWDKAPPLFMLKALKKQGLVAYYQLLHLLELEGLRKSGTGFSPYEGALASPDNLEPNAHTHYAVTQLEDYANCPLGYFFRYILKLTPVEEIIDDFKPPERGSLLHKILENFYRIRIEKYSNNPTQIRVTPENLEEASGLMLDCAKRVLHGFKTKYDNLFWENEKQNLLTGLCPQDNPQPQGILRAFLEHEAQSPDKLTPRYVEFRFGQDADIPALKLDGISLKGRVDRIDLAVDEGVFMVYDYKFGSAPSGLLIKQGLSFQLPVYMLAVADFLKTDNCKIGAGGYYQIKSANEIGKVNYFGKEDIRAQSAKDLSGLKSIMSRQRSFGFLADDEFTDQIKQVRASLAHIHQLITSGRFHPPLGDEDILSCSFCDYARICRMNTVRLAKMYAGLDDREHYKPLRER